MRTHHRIAFLCLKYIPITIFMVMWFSTTLAIFVASFVVADIMVGCAILPSLLILSVSKVFNFCMVHKSLTVYSMFTDLFINIERYFGLGGALVPIQVTLIVIGAVLVILLLRKVKLFKFINHENSDW